VDWQNSETERVANAIWSDPFTWQSFLIIAPMKFSGLEDPETRSRILAENIKGEVCGTPGMTDQSQEWIDFANTLGIDYGKVDWMQIAKWIMEKSIPEEELP
jgi:hypothetical protein